MCFPMRRYDWVCSGCPHWPVLRMCLEWTRWSLLMLVFWRAGFISWDQHCSSIMSDSAGVGSTGRAYPVKCSASVTLCFFTYRRVAVYKVQRELFYIRISVNMLFSRCHLDAETCNLLAITFAILFAEQATWKIDITALFSFIFIPVILCIVFSSCIYSSTPYRLFCPLCFSISMKGFTIFFFFLCSFFISFFSCSFFLFQFQISFLSPTQLSLKCTFSNTTYSKILLGYQKNSCNLSAVKIYWPSSRSEEEALEA